jgi:hypothetical protein
MMAELQRDTYGRTLHSAKLLPSYVLWSVLICTPPKLCLNAEKVMSHTWTHHRYNDSGTKHEIENPWPYQGRFRGCIRYPWTWLPLCRHPASMRGPTAPLVSHGTFSVSLPSVPTHVYGFYAYGMRLIALVGGTFCSLPETCSRLL